MIRRQATRPGEPLRQIDGWGEVAEGHL